MAALTADAEWTQEDVSRGSAVTHELVGKYLSYLCAIGFLQPPNKSGASQLPSLTVPREQVEAQKYIGGRGATS